MSRARRAKRTEPKTTTGRMLKVTSASFQFSASITPGDPGQQDQVLEDEGDERGEELVHVLDVARDAGDQPPDRVAGEELEGEVLDVVEDAHAQVVHDALAGDFHDHGLGEVEREVTEHEGDEKRGQEREAGDVAAAQPGELVRGEGGQGRVGRVRGLAVDLGQARVAAEDLRRGRVGEVDPQAAAGGLPPGLDPGAVVRGHDVAVDRLLGQDRQRELEERDQHHQADRPQQRPEVRPAEGRQASQQLEVVGLPEPRFLEVVELRRHARPLRFPAAGRCGRSRRSSASAPRGCRRRPPGRRPSR